MVYISSFLFVFLHYPGIRFSDMWHNFPKSVIVIPLYVPTIIQAYGHVLIHDPWPWNDPDETPVLDEWVHKNGAHDECGFPDDRMFCSSARFSTKNNDWIYNVHYDINGAHRGTNINYSETAMAMAPVKIGSYICLYLGYNSGIWPKPRCVRISRNSNRLYWHEIGRSIPLEIHFDQTAHF